MNSGLKILGKYYRDSKICSGISYIYNNNYLISNGYDSLILSFIIPFIRNQ